jgi:hypothetical protein
MSVQVASTPAAALKVNGERGRLTSTFCRAPFVLYLSEMRQPAPSFDVVRTWAKEFPDLEESTMYGSPAIKLGKRLVACLASHRSAEPASLVVRTDFEQRAGLLAEDPHTFYLTDHYVSHPVVLVRMTRLRHDQLRELLAAARHCVITHARKRVLPREQSPKNRSRQ